MKNKLTVRSNKYMLYAEEMRWSPIRVTETAHTINVNSSTSEVAGHMVGPACLKVLATARLMQIK